MKTIISVSLFSMFFTSWVFANGSSGIGSVKVPVTDEVEIQLDSSKFQHRGNKIINTQEAREVLVLEEISSQEFSQQVSKYVPSKLGMVKAWEYLPDRDLENNKLNSWIVCSKNKNCTKILATSESGRDAGALIGALVKSEK